MAKRPSDGTYELSIEARDVYRGLPREVQKRVDAGLANAAKAGGKHREISKEYVSLKGYDGEQVFAGSAMCTWLTSSSTKVRLYVNSMRMEPKRIDRDAAPTADAVRTKGSAKSPTSPQGRPGKRGGLLGRGRGL